MSDGWFDCGVDYCSQPDYGPRPWGRLAIRLGIAYLLIAALCWWEWRFRGQGIELPARVDVVGEVNTGGRNAKTMHLVRYHFRDPTTGKMRMNTVQVLPSEVPKGRTAVIEFVPGNAPMSRLKSQVNTYVETVFLWMNLILVTGFIALIGMIVWEAKHPYQISKRYSRSH